MADPTSFVLPTEIRDHVDFIEPTVTFPPTRTVTVRTSWSGQRSGQKMNTADTEPLKKAGGTRRGSGKLDEKRDGPLKTDPSSLRSLYQMGDHEASGNPNNTQVPYPTLCCPTLTYSTIPHPTLSEQ